MALNPTAKANAFEFIVSSLPGLADVTLLRAAAQAGATSVLNLEALDDRAAVDALQALTRGKTGRVGIRIADARVLRVIPQALIDQLDLVIVAPTVDDPGPLVAHVRGDARTVLFECLSAEDARLGVESGVDGLIAKGHEAGGRVGEETTFVLLQRLLAGVGADLPVWAHGGISPHTAAGCAVAGAAGAVLDIQLFLLRESTAPEPVKRVLARFGGDETLCLGASINERYRVHRRPGLTAVDELVALEERIDRDGATLEGLALWRSGIEARINWGTGAPLWPIGQDGAFAAELASAHRSAAGLLAAMHEAVSGHIAQARTLRPLDRLSPLAAAHGTEYPILQGPMTRVSDVAAFAAAVAEGGALPFLALALLREPELRTLFTETRQLLGDRPWGVGILGFVPLELRQEQLAVVQEFAPKFALIAGGRPDQAEVLERQGITTYLHVPAPSLLRIFLDQGARHFIFEGRECGGHVGPRTSFILWHAAVTTLLEALDKGVAPDSVHAVFAGGIHDARSAAMVAAIAAPLAQRGVKVGVLLGTAYLYTEEAVASGAIQQTFQEEAITCETTVLLESGPGHATRCADTAFAQTFKDRRRELLAAGKHPDDIRVDLEALNLGRLRIASKGVRRSATRESGGAALEPVSADEQRKDGMFMIGQVAGLRHETCRVADLHADVSLGSTRLLRGRKTRTREARVTPATSLACEVAIVGMGCLLPKAQDLRTLWANILAKKDAISEVPKERFDVDKYYDPNRRARDKIYSKSGGFLDEVPFDPMKHGMPPTTVPSIDPFQLLTLEVVNQALRDAGYADRPFDRERTSVILGASGGVGDLGFRYGIRAGLPMFFDTVSEDVLGRLPEWTEDSFAGVLLNVAAGRVANRLDLGGLNFTVDAACASSLAAIFMAARELESGSSEMVIVGGIDTVNSPFGYLCFGSAQALSPTGRCRTFDESADGIAISEGLSVLVLKRLAEAERAGDRIYAVIRAVAGSSDGKGKGLTAPRPEGQARVLERAYAAAGVSPASVSLIEAHGTGTIAGDGAEVSALSRVFAGAGAAPQTCAIGSIKSMIGHTKSAAGVTGVLKVALALHHKILPPTLNVSTPNAKLRDPNTPFYVNSEARPWVAPSPDEPRRAGVSSFGFGGTNFHVVLEEYDRQPAGVLPAVAPVDEWPAELAVWHAASPERLAASLERLESVLPSLVSVPLRSIAAAICRQDGATAGPVRLAIVAANLDELRARIRTAREALAAGIHELADPDGIFMGVADPAGTGVAFLYPGQGSQYCNMQRELALAFPELRQAIEAADHATDGRFTRPLSAFVYPPPTFTRADEELRQRELTDTSVAQPALGAVEAGLTKVLASFGVTPRFAAGHSYGEYVALWSAGVFDLDTLFTLSAERGRVMKAATVDHPSTMAAVSAGPDAVRAALAGVDDVWVANLNAPRQTVVAGTVPAIERALETLGAAGLSARRIPVACAFHSPLVEPSREEFAGVLGTATMQDPVIPVFSNTLGAEYTGGADEIRTVLADHIVRPVRFVEQVQAMHARGARVFLEVGPRSVLSTLTRESLAGRDALVVSMDSPERRGLVQLLFVVAQLTAAGVPIDYEICFRGRSIEPIRVDRALPRQDGLAPHLWMVSGGRARPLSAGRAKVADGSAAAAATSVPAGPAVPAAPVAAADSAVSPVPAVPSASVPQVPPTASVPSIRPASSAAATAAALASRMTPTRSSHGALMDQSQPPTLVRGDHEVIRQFQQLMGQFLQTQALVMTAYLQGSARALPVEMVAPASMPLTPQAMPVMPMPAVAPPPTAPIAAAPVVSPVPAAPVVTAAARQAAPVVVAPAVEMPAGRVDVKVVPTEKQEAPVVNGAGHVNGAAPGGHAKPMAFADVLKEVIRIVADRTGYPEDMLDVDSNIEADLGIDSIKRMEILTAFQELHAGASASSLQGSLERLTAQKTLRDTATLLTELLTPQAVTVS